MAADVLDELKQIVGNKTVLNNVDIFLNSLYPGQNMDVPDPWYGTEEGYHDVYALIEKTCDAIIEQQFEKTKNPVNA